eukprot:6650622-Prorocentrum_lima.AAC.1
MTQHGFREHRGARDALFCVRRAGDIGEATKQPVFLVMLDWEKAFDTLAHDRLIAALDRLSVPTLLLEAICAMYSRPTFQVELQGALSVVKEQKRGIRQGCPLSPYLFIAVMTVLIYDVKQLLLTKGISLEAQRLAGILFDETLFADDTSLIGSDRDVVEEFLHAVEEVSARYGLRLNKAKCE